jgi:hypothetical protein
MLDACSGKVVVADLFILYLQGRCCITGLITFARALAVLTLPYWQLTLMSAGLSSILDLPIQAFD